MRITALTISTAFIDECRRFYVERLGFAEYEVIGGSDGLAMQSGYTRFTFVPGTADARYHFAFNIRPDQLPDAADWLMRCGVELIPSPAGQGYEVDFPDWKARSVYFFDPAGNIVEIIGRAALGPAGNAPRFSAASLLGVSEIGMVTDDLPAYRDWLSGVHGIPAFVRQENTDRFTALGDDEGLLLLVPPGREWYMGRFLAEKHPVALTVENGGREIKLRLG
ncbi:MAG: VOC family protein [Bacteroidia bacterium]|nr:VOC family protein [Bacteroidia bacterium]